MTSADVAARCKCGPCKPQVARAAERYAKEVALPLVEAAWMLLAARRHGTMEDEIDAVDELKTQLAKFPRNIPQPVKDGSAQ